MKRVLIGCFSAAIVFVVGCGEQKDSTEVSKPGAVPTAAKTFKIPAWDRSISDQATLVAKLPQEALLYMRIPNLWGLLNSPKKNSLHAALSSEANQVGTQKLQKGVASLVASKFGPMAPAINFFTTNLRSPLEMAVVAGKTGDPASIQVVLSGKLAYESLEAFNTALQQVTAMHPLAQWIKPADSQQPGQIMVGPANLQFSFDTTSQRMLFVGALSLTPEQFTVIQDWKGSDQPHPIEKLENRIDSERTGLMVWANVEMAAPIIKPIMPPKLATTLEDLGVLSSQQFGFGFGSASGKGRFLIAATGDKGLVWELAPPPVVAPEFNTAGIPDLLLAINLPTYTWVIKLIDEIARQQGDDPQTVLDEANAGLIKNIGIDLKTLVDGISGSYFFVFDRNGSYIVHQNAQPIPQESLNKAIAEKLKVRIEEKTVKNVSLSHMIIPSIMNENGALMEDANSPEETLMAMYQSMNSHIYWVTEGKNRVYAEIPQVLLDRHKFPSDVKLAEWLKQTGADFNHTLFYIMANMDNVPRINYYAYLSLLNALGDILGQPMDLTEFPSARELGLPESGIFSFQLDYTNQQLGAGLTYESHPTELFYGGGGAMGAAAVAGIMAAIAIPAYQDYIIRAEVATAMMAVAPLKQKLEKHIQTKGTLPKGEVAKSFIQPIQDNNLDAIYFDETVGGIVLDFSAQSKKGDDSKIYFFPETDEKSGMLIWSCQADGGLNEKHLPRSCR